MAVSIDVSTIAPCGSSPYGCQEVMYRLFILILCASLPLRAYGDCANDSAQIKLALPPEALSIRNVLFSQLPRSDGLNRRQFVSV